jgi:hypothetical protein
MIKRIESLKNTVNKYMVDILTDLLTTCQSERKSVVSRRPSVIILEYLSGCYLLEKESANWSWLTQSFDSIIRS